MESLKQILEGVNLEGWTEADERLDRSAEARSIRDRLPHFLRAQDPRRMLGNVHDARLALAVAAWAPEQGSLVLLGPTRAGKSTAAAWLFRRLLGAGVRLGGDAWGLANGLSWYAASELARARREHPLGRGDAPEIREAINATALVLDDLGWDRDPAPVADVLAARYELGRVTIGTSGRTREQLIEHYGPAPVRRLLEAGGRSPVIVNLFKSAEAA